MSVCIIDAVLTGEEVVLLKSKAALLEERNALSLAPISFLDVREKLQLLCDQVSYDKLFVRIQICAFTNCAINRYYQDNIVVDRRRIAGPTCSWTRKLSTRMNTSDNRTVQALLISLNCWNAIWTVKVASESDVIHCG